MITVEIVLADDGSCKQIVEIYFDRKGLDELQQRLELLGKGKVDHIHMMSESWGLGDLAETKHRENNQIVHHLQLDLVE